MSVSINGPAHACLALMFDTMHVGKAIDTMSSLVIVGRLLLSMIITQCQLHVMVSFVIVALHGINKGSLFGYPGTLNDNCKIHLSIKLRGKAMKNNYYT